MSFLGLSPHISPLKTAIWGPFNCLLNTFSRTRPRAEALKLLHDRAGLAPDPGRQGVQVGRAQGLVRWEDGGQATLAGGEVADEVQVGGLLSGIGWKGSNQVLSRCLIIRCDFFPTYHAICIQNILLLPNSSRPKLSINWLRIYNYKSSRPGASGCKILLQRPVLKSVFLSEHFVDANEPSLIKGWIILLNICITARPGWVQEIWSEPGRTVWPKICTWGSWYFRDSNLICQVEINTSRIHVASIIFLLLLSDRTKVKTDSDRENEDLYPYRFLVFFNHIKNTYLIHDS